MGQIKLDRPKALVVAWALGLSAGAVALPSLGSDSREKLSGILGNLRQRQQQRNLQGATLPIRSRLDNANASDYWTSTTSPAIDTRSGMQILATHPAWEGTTNAPSALVAFDVAKDIAWKVDLDSSVCTDPVIGHFIAPQSTYTGSNDPAPGDAILSVAASSGTVYAIDVPTGSLHWSASIPAASFPVMSSPSLVQSFFSNAVDIENAANNLYYVAGASVVIGTKSGVCFMSNSHLHINEYFGASVPSNTPVLTTCTRSGTTVDDVAPFTYMTSPTLAVASGFMSFGADNMLYGVPFVSKYRFPSPGLITNSVGPNIHLGLNPHILPSNIFPSSLSVTYQRRFKFRLTASAYHKTHGFLIFGSGPSLFAVEATTGVDAWAANTPARINAEPAIGADGLVYVSSGSDVIAFDGRWGTKSWSYTLPARQLSSLAIAADNSIVVSGSNRVVYTLTEATDPSPTPTSSASASSTSTSSITASRTMSSTRTASSTLTSSATTSATSTMSITSSNTVSVTVTVTPSRSTSPSVSETATRTPVSPSPSSKCPCTPSVTSSITSTTSVSPTGTLSVSVTPSTTPTVSVTPSTTPTVSVSASTTLSISVSASVTASHTSSSSLTASLSMTTTNTASFTPSLSRTPSVTVSITLSATRTASLSRSGSVSASVSVSPSVSPSTSMSPSKTPSITITTTISATLTSTGTITPTMTETATVTTTVTATASLTSSASSSATLSPSLCFTFTATVTSTATTSRTETRSATSTASVSRTVTVTQTISSTATMTREITTSATPTRSSTRDATSSVTVTTTRTTTPSPSYIPSASASPRPMAVWPMRGYAADHSCHSVYNGPRISAKLKWAQFIPRTESEFLMYAAPVIDSNNLVHVGVSRIDSVLPGGGLVQLKEVSPSDPVSSGSPQPMVSDMSAPSSLSTPSSSAAVVVADPQMQAISNLMDSLKSALDASNDSSTNRIIGAVVGTVLTVAVVIVAAAIYLKRNKSHSAALPAAASSSSTSAETAKTTEGASSASGVNLQIYSL